MEIFEIGKKKAGKFSIKSSASQACDIQGSRVEEDQDQEEVDQNCARPRSGLVDQDFKKQEFKTREAVSISMPRLGTPKVSSSH